jgi:hypothetical protein
MVQAKETASAKALRQRAIGIEKRQETRSQSEVSKRGREKVRSKVKKVKVVTMGRCSPVSWANATLQGSKMETGKRTVRSWLEKSRKERRVAKASVGVVEKACCQGFLKYSLGRTWSSNGGFPDCSPHAPFLEEPLH